MKDTNRSGGEREGCSASDEYMISRTENERSARTTSLYLGIIDRGACK